jgi:FkbM family methyltransferase
VPRGPLKRQTLAVLRLRQVPVATVIDVGVLSGTPELLEVYPDRPHLLFEPVAEFAARIEHEYRNVPHRLIQAAVSDSSGEIQLRTVGMIGGAAISHSFMTESAEEATRTVPRVSLDDYLRTTPADPPYFLKIDIDGEELKVLAGATATLKQTSIVMIEVTVHTMIPRLQRLMDAGFQLFDLTEPAYYDDSLWQCDAVFVRADLHERHFEALSEQLDLAKYSVFGA